MDRSPAMFYAIYKKPNAWLAAFAALTCALGLWFSANTVFSPASQHSVSASLQTNGEPKKRLRDHAAIPTIESLPNQQSNESDCAFNTRCDSTKEDPVFSIVADQRNWARVESLQASAMEVLSAIGHRDDKPVGVDFAAVSDVAKVLLVEGDTHVKDAYQLLFRNDAGDIVLLVELSSLGTDDDGYEQLGYDSLLAFSGAIDASFLSSTNGANSSANSTAATFNPRRNLPGFPYATYPPVSYQDALAVLEQPLDQLRDNDNSKTLATLKTSNGEDLWGRSLAYEITLDDARGQPVSVWIDAFLGIRYSAADLDTARLNVEKRNTIDATMDPKLRAKLLQAGTLDDYLIESIPLSAKEAERMQALRAHEANYGNSLANI